MVGLYSTMEKKLYSESIYWFYLGYNKVHLNFLFFSIKRYDKLYAINEAPSCGKWHKVRAHAVKWMFQQILDLNPMVTKQ